MTADRRVPMRVFGGIAVFIAALAAVYWAISYEDAGTTMLVAAAGLAATIGVWLFLHERAGGVGHAGEEGTADDEAVAYLPESSPWPFAMAGGAALALNGLILSWAYATPGLVLLVVAIIGFVAQGRRRG